jgi:uncharacterized protein YbjQ (UPF0145 family)
VTFGSTFSVADFAFAREAHLQPVRAVHGCNVTFVSEQMPAVGWGRTGVPGRAPVTEPPAPVAAVDAAVQRGVSKVFEQVREQAAIAGAAAVVDLRSLPAVLDIGVSDLPGSLRGRGVLRGLRELQMVGTAVRGPGFERGTLVLSTLAAADVWKLAQRGWRPVGIASASSYQFGGSGLFAGSAAREVEGATMTWSAARRAAFARLRAEGERLRADGLVGVDVQVERRHFEWSQNQREYSGLLIGVNILASAIARGPRAGAATSLTSIATLR